jgi:archaellum component FlaC
MLLTDVQELKDGIQELRNDVHDVKNDVQALTQRVNVVEDQCVFVCSRSYHSLTYPTLVCGLLPCAPRI